MKRYYGFIFLVMVLSLTLPFSQAQEEDPQSTTEKILQVTDAFPAKDSVAEPDTDIVIFFNRPVVPLVTSADKDKLPNPLVISPTIEGTGEWLNTSIYQFRPSETLGGGATYTVTIPKDSLIAVDGSQLSEDFTLSFTTMPPSITDTYPYPDSSRIALDDETQVRFSVPMDKASVERAFYMRPDQEGSQNVSGTFTWTADNRGFRFKPSGNLLQETRYIIGLTEEAVAEGGGASLSNDNLFWYFNTIEFPRVTSTSPNNGDSDVYAYGYGFTLFFSAPMNISTLKDRLIIDPAPPIDPDTYYSEYSYSYDVSFLLYPDITYTVTLEAGAEDIYGNAIAEPYTFTFKTGNYESETNLQVPSNVGFFNAYREPTALYMTHLNVESIDVSLYKLTLAEFLSADEYNYKPSTDNEVLTWTIPNVAPFNARRFELLNFADQVNRATGCTDSLPTRLSVGMDAIVISDPDPVRARAEIPDGEIVDLLYKDYALPIVAGPQCANGILFWQATTRNNTLVWVAESADNEYFLAPRDDASATPVATVNSAFQVTPNDSRLPSGFYFVKATPNRGYDYNTTHAMLVATANLTMKYSYDTMLVWATDVQSGLPLANAPITLYNQRLEVIGRGTTDANGLLQMNMPPFSGSNNDYERYALLDDGTNFGLGSTYWSASYDGYVYGNDYRIYMYTDRPLYRPDQPVYFKGIVRYRDDMSYTLRGATTVPVIITDDNGDIVYEKELTLTEYGTFSDSFQLAPDSALGYYRISSSVSESNVDYYGNSGGIGFSVAEYRLPEFQVNLEPLASEVVQGDTVQVQVDSKYFFGGSVSNANINYSVYVSPYYFSYDGKKFYDFIDYDSDYGASEYYGYGGDNFLADGVAKTDDNGMFVIEVPASLQDSTQSLTYTVEVAVRDESDQVIANRTTVTIHKGLIYAGVRSSRYVAREDQPMNLELITVDWESTGIANQDLEVRIVERIWSSVQEQSPTGETTWNWDVEEVPVLDATVRTGEDGTALQEFIPENAGIYKAYVTTRDSKGNEITASTQFYVSGSEYVSWRQQNSNRIDLISDKTDYNIGDMAEILITSPFQGTAEAIVTVERGDVLKVERVTLTSNSYVYQLPIEAGYAPNVYVSVFIVKGVDENNPVTAYRVGYVQLGVDTSQKVITLEVDSDVDSASPQQTVTYTVQATDYQGNPVQAELGVGVTDLAALSLLPMNSGTLLDFYYSKQGLGIETATALSINTDQLTQQILETFKGGGGGAIGGGVIELRGEFIDTPFWNGTLTTDANGMATFDVRLPDNLTTWRTDIRAVTQSPDGNMLVGQTTFDLQSTKPVLIRPVTPRFFIRGDEVTLGAVVNNNTDEIQTVVISLDITGVTLKDNNPSQTVEIPAKGRGRVSWNVLVNDVDTVVATFTADAGQYTDATISGVSLDDIGSLPVYKYEVPETVGTAGVLFDEGSLTESIVLPASEQGDVTVRVDYSLAGAALETLRAYERLLYDCIECIISELLPNIITYRALENAGVANPELKERLEYAVNRALQKIFAEQKVDGGWGWYVTEPSNPLVTAYALIGLTEAKKQGFAISDNVFIRAQDFIRTQFITPSLSVPRWQMDRQVFLLYALACSGVPDVGRTTAIYEDNQRLSLYSQALLAQSLFIINPNDKARLDTLANILINAAITSATGVFWSESERDYYNWNTNTRTTAVILQTLIQLRPDSQLLPNVVRHLMVQREADVWETTQETAWAIMALTDWMVLTNELNPSYSYSVNANGADILSDSATQNTALDSETLQIAVMDLLRDQANTFIFERSDGEGAMYYTAFLNAYLPVPEIEQYENGIFVSRVYTLMGDAERNPITQGKVGDIVQVRLTIVAPNPLYYAVITDPLPAGAEAIDPRLNSSQQIGTRPQLNPQDPLSRGWGWWYFSDVDFRDEKVVLSSTYLPAGTYEYVYSMRLSVAGTYNVIPTTAQEFYFPDVYGRSDGLSFVVLPSE